MSSNQVFLYIYDLSGGLMSGIGSTLLGGNIDAIYHTSVVVFGREFFYGGDGITDMTPLTTPYGQPIERQLMGVTSKAATEWHTFLDSIRGRFRYEDYNIMNHNCNHFSNEACMFLLGKPIPDKIIRQVENILSTPIGSLARPIIERMMASGSDPLSPLSSLPFGIGGAGGNPFASLGLPSASPASTSRNVVSPPPPPPPQDPMAEFARMFPNISSARYSIFAMESLEKYGNKILEVLGKSDKVTENEIKWFDSFIKEQLLPALQVRPFGAAPDWDKAIDIIARGVEGVERVETFALLDAVRMMMLVENAAAGRLPESIAIHTLLERFILDPDHPPSESQAVSTALPRIIANAVAKSGLGDVPTSLYCKAAVLLLKSDKNTVVSSAASMIVNIVLAASTEQLGAVDPEEDLKPARLLASNLGEIIAKKSPVTENCIDILARAAGRLIGATFSVDPTIASIISVCIPQSRRQELNIPEHSACVELFEVLAKLC